MPDFLPVLADYLHKIETVRANPQATDELSLRHALSVALDATRDALGKNVEWVGEGKRNKAGQPDYITTRSHLPIGYIEAEKPDADLDALKGNSKTTKMGFAAYSDPLFKTACRPSNHTKHGSSIGAI